MGFLESVDQARGLLERNQRLSLKALRREFELDAEALADLIDELVQVQRIATQDGEILVWIGPEPSHVTPSRSTAPPRVPQTYTPKHLADKILQSKSALEGERKQVTVLFADIQGSMQLASQLDPEHWHQLLERYFAILTEAVHRFEGTVNQYTGDGIMALFGAPIAHEDHARRACYAALQARDHLRAFADELRLTQGLNFSFRIGMNSGDVVVGKIGDDLRMDSTAQGATVGIAQRIEQLAAPGHVYLSGATERLVVGYFHLRAMGKTDLKGMAEALPLFELETTGSARNRLDVAVTRGLSRFVGRTAEMQTLDAALERTQKRRQHQHRAREQHNRRRQLGGKIHRGHERPALKRSASAYSTTSCRL